MISIKNCMYTNLCYVKMFKDFLTFLGLIKLYNIVSQNLINLWQQTIQFLKEHNHSFQKKKFRSKYKLKRIFIHFQFQNYCAFNKIIASCPTSEDFQFELTKPENISSRKFISLVENNCVTILHIIGTKSFWLSK